jgi:hypothetical protein
VIWIPQNSDADREHALVTHLKQTITANSLGEFLGDEGRAADVASAVAAFLEAHGGADQVVDSGYLVMLASQAMSAVGEPDDARRLLVFGSGLVRPAEWEVSGGDEVWTIDLHRITVTDGTPLELVFFNALGMVVESIADVWDTTSGRGVLGLRHVCATARLLLGRTRKKDAVQSLVEEITGICSDRLGRAREQRRWETAPVVMNLDIDA